MVAFENTPSNKNMFKVDDTRATSSVNVWVSFDWPIKYFLKSVTETVLIKLQALKMAVAKSVFTFSL